MKSVLYKILHPLSFGSPRAERGAGCRVDTLLLLCLLSLNRGHLPDPAESGRRAQREAKAPRQSSPCSDGARAQTLACSPLQRWGPRPDSQPAWEDGMSVVTFETKSAEEKIVFNITETCKQTENCVWPSDGTKGQLRLWNLGF